MRRLPRSRAKWPPAASELEQPAARQASDIHAASLAALAGHGAAVRGRDLADPAMHHFPVGAIGGRWGFADPAHFSRLFKTVYGMSPREARGARR
uniref:AraC family transcriptional regulator n=1 Tax=Streptomyces asoensis TaxID=249586 RepID=UPI003F5A6FE7